MYAKLIDNTLVFARHYIEINNKTILNPQEKDYIDAGYKIVEYEQMPTISENQEIVTTYIEDDEKIKVVYSIKEKSMSFEEYKDFKISENEQKRNVEYINTSLGKLKTSTPLGDLKTALPLYDKIALANNGLPQGAVRLYVNGEVTLSPQITLEQYNNLSTAIAVEYLKIDALSTKITAQIMQAKTINDLEKINIDYSQLPNI